MLLRTCNHEKEGPCCMRTDGKCSVLFDTKFRDGMCHFRKKDYYGPNLYDAGNPRSKRYRKET